MGKFTIYLRRNKVNGKCYVGQTSDFKRRENEWKCLNYYYANGHICNDRAKYGLDNWTVETLAEVDNREDAWELEQRFINDYNTLWPNGYNLSKGGGGPNGVHHSDETRQKMSEAKKGEKNYWYGKHLYDETRQKMSKAKKGKEQSEEQIKNASEARKKTIFQYTLDGELVKIWPSAKDVYEELEIPCHISECCKNKRKTCGGYMWSYTPL